MQKYKIKNIDCPSCAAKIENNLSKLKDVKYVSINFADASMFIDTDNMEKVRRVISESEPGVEIIDVKEDVRRSGITGNDRKELRKKFLFIAAVVIIYIMAFIVENSSIGARFPAAAYIMFLSAYLLSGWDVLYNAAQKILKGKLFDEHFLMSVATLGAIAINQMAEAAGVMLFYQVGELFQQLSVKRSRSSIKSLIEIKPNFANLLIDNSTIRVSPGEVKTGDLILVKPGEKIPLDGIVTEGNSLIDTSPLTGEPVPRTVTAGKEVLAGTINKEGLLKIKVTRLFENSSVSRILELVENAASQKAQTEKFITRFSAYYTPAVVAIALLIALVPPILFNQNFSEWIYRALVILVISCPCALVVSIPLGYFGGLGAASRKGILIKGSNFLDALTDVKTVVFDKTGTLTKGVFRVLETVPYNGFSKEELLLITAQAEMQSNHPVAKSIREAAEEMLRNSGSDINLLADSSISEYREIPGYGIIAEVNGKRLIAGNDRLMHSENIDHNDCIPDRSVIHVALENRYAGYLIISDEPKEEALHSVRYLRNLGIKKIILLTGDNSEAAQNISRDLDIDEYYAGLLPEDKVDVLEKIMKEMPRGEKTAFAGDGINDAPVIARADVGVAMGALGSDAAIETADVVLMTDNPSKIGTAIEIARKTRRIVWQNISFALGVKLFFIVLGTFGSATMWEAVFGDMGVALIAIVNALRILK